MPTWPITPVTERNGEGSLKPAVIRTKEAIESANKEDLTLAQNLVMILVSVFLSLGLWMYIQINNNPVVTKEFTVPITYEDNGMPEDIEVSLPVSSVRVELVGRRSTIESISEDDIIATLDYSNVTEAGVAELPVVITSADSNVYFRVQSQLPDTVSVTVYSTNEN